MLLIPRRPLHDLDFTDMFCGAGGSATGLVEAGYILRLAANHDPVSIRTHVANHPMAEHICADLNNYDKRRLPRTRILWGSPICTEIAPCGGRKRTRGQLALELEGDAAPETFERTRATALDILAATDIHRYDAVLCENVIEFATDWELFDWWLSGMRILGYNHQIVCASSAHLGGLDEDNLLAPQLRDRLYVVFTREGIALPDLAVRPAATCPECGPVRAVQVWRNPRRRRVGKWGEQYDYRCPNTGCGEILVPHTRPVSDIIEWDVPGTRIGDGRPNRKVFTPYAATTRARVAQGLQMFGPAPHVAMLRNNGTAVSVNGPVPTLNAQGRHHALVVPIGRKGLPRTTGEPMTTLATKPHHSLVTPAASVDDCTLRMFTPRELMRAQRLPDGYILHGNVTEMILQTGNAVSVNAARWLGGRLLPCLA
ncbi:MULTISPECIES: DNA cytosine methyltransferase [unclassified Streptomyces]|uniref:DNA cytosine methyltransferase n=1 Tax=unclassified Streptomyces TaxID=2593676 RepID=UPI000DBA8425|nr:MULTISPECIES: DNA cytosine methyltransferase [unclassified Streptomyces]MYT68375.1 DNA cytosine methyltransferase [Streptomyces sp. SID8367]RAJ77012.1 DNA (cytosine-5)-methyltransferase 1 [Streptomyces sp. PsTaAH-137]